MLLATATLIIAVITYLEVEAHSNAESAATSAQLRQIKASTTEINGRAQVSYDWTSAYRTWLELDYQALSANIAHDFDAEDRYTAQRDKLRDSSVLLENYFPSEKPTAGDYGKPDVAHYEVDLYYKEIQILGQESNYLNEIKEFWHKQQSVFLTSLAFLSSALFIAGLALTTPRPLARGLAITATVVMVAATAYAVQARLKPAPVVPEEAIKHYAEGKGFYHRGMYSEAIGEYEQALKQDGEFTDAAVALGDSHLQLGTSRLASNEDQAKDDLREAIKSYKEARDEGRDDAESLWNFGWAYFLLGDYDNAIATDSEAMKLDPDLYLVRHNLGLAYLVRNLPVDPSHGRAKSDVDMAMEAFGQAQTDATAKAKKGPEYLAPVLSDLDDMALDFENLWLRLDGLTYDWIEAPSFASTSRPDELKERAAKLRDQIRTLQALLQANLGTGVISSVSLPAPELPKNRKIDMGVAGYTSDSSGNPSVSHVGPALPEKTMDVRIDIDFSGMDGVKTISWRLYHNGQENRLRARTQDWPFEASGSIYIPINYSYTSLWYYPKGYYVLELYVDNVLAKQIDFTVGDY
jgi:tetratricopeptide (TPR) repeat protein